MSALRKKMFSQGIQGMDLGIKSETLAKKIACLLFVDDVTITAPNGHECEALLTKYQQFCAKFRLNLNAKKCKVIRFRNPEPTKGKPVGAERAAMQAQYDAKLEATKPFMKLNGIEVPEVNVAKVLGINVQWDLQPAHARKCAERKLNRQLPVIPWIRTYMGRDYALKYAASTAAPKVTWGSGVARIPPGFLRSMGNRANKVALGLSSRYGQQNIPNLAVTELSGQMPWDIRSAKENSTLEASLRSKGDSLPRQFFQKKSAQKKVAVRFQVLKGVPTISDKADRKMRGKEIAKQMRDKEIYDMKKKAKQNVPDSITRFYCETTVAGKFAKVFDDTGRQILLERQALGLVDFPTTAGKDAPKQCPLCGGPNTVLHTVFRCAGLSEEREALLKALTNTVQEKNLDPKWGVLSEEQKLTASYAPGTRIADKARRIKFYSASMSLWDKFRGAGAKKVMASQKAKDTAP